MQHLPNTVLDAGLNYIKSNAASLELITGYNDGDSLATVQAASICSISLVSGDFTVGDASPDGRKVTLTAKSGNSSGDSNQYEAGTASGGDADSLTDSSAAFSDRTGKAIVITGGTGAGQVRRIASNTGTVMTVTEDWDTVPDATSTYAIRDDLHWAVVSGTEVLSVHGEASKQVVTSGNPVNSPALDVRFPDPVPVEA